MENKNIIIILVAVIAIIAVVGFIFTSGILNQNDNGVTTPFETEFMEGSFVGNVTLVDGKEKFMHSYQDKEHGVTYNISTVDNSTALMEIYELQGVSNPEERTFNGNDWKIYFTQAVPDNTSADTKAMTIIMCESQGEKQGYGDGKDENAIFQDNPKCHGKFPPGSIIDKTSQAVTFFPKGINSSGARQGSQ